MVRRMDGRHLTAGGPPLCGLGLALPSAAGCQGDLAQRLHHRNLDCRAVLVLFEIDLGDGGACQRRHVAWRDPVQGKHHGVLSADLAAAELGEMGTERIVRPDHVVFREVANHTTARAGATTAPVKVEPVVPVSRTWWYCPTLERGSSSRTSWLVRVRASMRSPRLAGRSTRASCSSPTR